MFEHTGVSHAFLIQALLGLVVVIALIYGCAFVFKRLVQPKLSASSIQFLGFIDTKRRVFMITVPHANSPQKFLYITSPNRDVCLPLDTSDTPPNLQHETGDTA